MLYELIEFVHVDVHEELTGKVAQGQARVVAIYDAIKKPFCLIILRMQHNNPFQNLMIYAGKKLPDVAFENPARFGVVFAGLIRKSSEAIQCPMGTFAELAGKRVGDEFGCKEGIENAINGVVQ